VLRVLVRRRLTVLVLKELGVPRVLRVPVLLERQAQKVPRVLQVLAPFALLAPDAPLAP